MRDIQNFAGTANTGNFGFAFDDPQLEQRGFSINDLCIWKTFLQLFVQDLGKGQPASNANLLQRFIRREPLEQLAELKLIADLVFRTGHFTHFQHD
ncbi:MAG: hypothetical protein ABR956_17405, partial [Terracidiphilus sp.]